MYTTCVIVFYFEGKNLKVNSSVSKWVLNIIAF